MMRILLLDDYDSFTYNLYQFLSELGAQVEVKRNDEIEVEQIRELAPDKIVISPGPCTPTEAGIALPLIRELGVEIPILGVCLGHQAIGAAFGGRVIRAPELIHGKLSAIASPGRECVSRTAFAVHGDALPLADRGARDAAVVARDHRRDG